MTVGGDVSKAGDVVSGPWSLLAPDALTAQPGTYAPDFSVYVASETAQCLQISESVYTYVNENYKPDNAQSIRDHFLRRRIKSTPRAFIDNLQIENKLVKGSISLSALPGPKDKATLATAPPADSVSIDFPHPLTKGSISLSSLPRTASLSTAPPSETFSIDFADHADQLDRDKSSFSMPYMPFPEEKDSSYSRSPVGSDHKFSRSGSDPLDTAPSKKDKSLVVSLLRQSSTFSFSSWTPR